MRDVRVAHAEVEEHVIPAPAAHAVEERFEDDVDTLRGEAGVSGPGAAPARVLVDLRDVLRHDDAVVVRRHERGCREDPLEAPRLVSVEWVGLGRHPVELLRESELPVVGTRLEILEGPVGRADL